MTNFTDTIPHLNIEVLPDGLIRLENESMGDSYVVDIHPVQLRHIAEKMGLVESGDPTAQKAIATLQRRMVLLRDRIDNLHSYLVNHSDHRHADLTYEVTYITATIDIADEFCADFEATMPNQVTPDNASERHKSNAGNVTAPLPSAQFDLVA